MVSGFALNIQATKAKKKRNQKNLVAWLTFLIQTLKKTLSRLIISSQADPARENLT